MSAHVILSTYKPRNVLCSWKSISRSAVTVQFGGFLA